MKCTSLCFRTLLVSGKNTMLAGECRSKPTKKSFFTFGSNFFLFCSYTMHTESNFWTDLICYQWIENMVSLLFFYTSTCSLSLQPSWLHRAITPWADLIQSACTWPFQTVYASSSPLSRFDGGSKEPTSHAFIALSLSSDWYSSEINSVPSSGLRHFTLP